MASYHGTMLEFTELLISQVYKETVCMPRCLIVTGGPEFKEFFGQYFGGYSVFYSMMDSQIVFGDCVSVLQEIKKRNLALKWKNIKQI